MLRRRYRVTIEYDVEMQELSLFGIHRRHAEWLKRREARWGAEPPPFVWEAPTESEVEEMRALQRAIAETPDVFDAWVVDSLVSRMKEGLDIETLEPSEHPEQVLLPAVEALPFRTRHRYREAVAKRRLLDVADEMFQSIEMDVEAVEIEVVE